MAIVRSPWQVADLCSHLDHGQFGKGEGGDPNINGDVEYMPSVEQGRL